MMISPNKWEIWWAIVQYEDTNEKKKRPVLILENNSVASVIGVAKVTTHSPRNMYDYQISDLESCGLKKDSVIRFDKKIPIKETQLIYKVGKLNKKDIFQIKARFKGKTTIF